MSEKFNGKDEEADPMRIPINDKRRFSTEGEMIIEDPPAATDSVRPAAETALEAKLAAEIARREAAEAKLIGVQAKFEEAKADLEKETAEMRSRLMRSLEDRATQAQFNFLSTLLPVLDNLNLAVKSSETDPSIEHLREGVIGTARSFERALVDVGVEPIPTVGAVFDPELHEAVDVVESSGENDGKIMAEYARGYRLGNRLLRPARVQVGRAASQAAN